MPPSRICLPPISHHLPHPNACSLEHCHHLKLAPSLRPCPPSPTRVAGARAHGATGATAGRGGLVRAGAAHPRTTTNSCSARRRVQQGKCMSAHTSLCSLPAVGRVQASESGVSGLWLARGAEWAAASQGGVARAGAARPALILHADPGTRSPP